MKKKVDPKLPLFIKEGAGGVKKEIDNWNCNHSTTKNCDNEEMVH